MRAQKRISMHIFFEAGNFVDFSSVPENEASRKTCKMERLWEWVTLTTEDSPRNRLLT